MGMAYESSRAEAGNSSEFLNLRILCASDGTNPQILETAVEIFAISWLFLTLWRRSLNESVILMGHIPIGAHADIDLERHGEFRGLGHEPPEL